MGRRFPRDPPPASSAGADALRAQVIRLSMYYGEHGVVGFVGEGGESARSTIKTSFTRAFTSFRTGVKHTHSLRERAERCSLPEVEGGVCCLRQPPQREQMPRQPSAPSSCRDSLPPSLHLKDTAREGLAPALGAQATLSCPPPPLADCTPLPLPKQVFVLLSSPAEGHGVGNYTQLPCSEPPASRWAATRS